MVKLFNLEREAKLYEVTLIALSSLGADAKKIKDLMEEYIQILYPEHDPESNKFLDKAHNVLDRHIGKPFAISEEKKGVFGIRAEIDER